MVVHGVPHERPDHGIVGAEGRESLARAEREPGRPVVGAEQVVGRQDELVQVGVGVTPVDEAFAPVARRQLALGNREPLEVEHAGEPEAVRARRRAASPPAVPPAPRPARTARHGVGMLVGGDRLRPDPRPRPLLRRPRRPHGASARSDQPERRARQSDSAAAARTGATAARR